MPNRFMEIHRLNDYDFVPPEVYKSAKSGISLPAEIAKLEAFLTNFESIQLLDSEEKYILPNSAQILDEETLFRLLFDNKVLDIIIRYTNSNIVWKREEFINSDKEDI